MGVHRSLAAHYSACNELYYLFQDCEQQHPVRKFTGFCYEFKRKVTQCIKDERQRAREYNIKISKERFEDRRMRIMHQEKENRKE